MAEVYSFQSPFAYAANNPIYYIDYMGLGPKEWWEKFKGWVNKNILGKSYSGRDLVRPEREEREVVLTERVYLYSGSAKRDEFGDHWNYGDPIEPPHFSSFDYSNRRHVRGQGVELNRRYSGIQISQERKKLLGKTNKVVIGPPDDVGIRRVFNPIRRFLGLNMGNRIYISFNGNYPALPNQFGIDAMQSIYYTKILRMHGTHAFFRELERAGIIESLD